MGKGIAKTFTEKYPEMKKKLMARRRQEKQQKKFKGINLFDLQAYL